MKKRTRKKQARAAGLSPAELDLIELLEEVIERFAMLEVLSFANNFLITDRSRIAPEERERIFRAAQQAVAPESPVQVWRERLGRLKGEILEKKRAIRREQRRERKGKAPPLPGEDGEEEGA
jgi:hypothetical protein